MHSVHSSWSLKKYTFVCVIGIYFSHTHTKYCNLITLYFQCLTFVNKVSARNVSVEKLWAQGKHVQCLIQPHYTFNCNVSYAQSLFWLGKHLYCMFLGKDEYQIYSKYQRDEQMSIYIIQSLGDLGSKYKIIHILPQHWSFRTCTVQYACYGPWPFEAGHSGR